ncbi:aldolase [Ralstonia pseudosolanacearum]|uniref:HpcH/HpaI aldolase/citrate lyase family protein n=1 Tax=Ralstonia pseudosolanacearum TaxID=1310165 RepID=UPI000DAB4765|nr:aldolase/citrate lyase family protein [Ralstonia pseudosolanacearum]RAA04562.1 aldolase [Ralstonia pseudosolanacearum]
MPDQVLRDNMNVSYLFTPALKIGSLLKGSETRVDAVVLDLEDSIHISSKTEARDSVKYADVASLRHRHAEVGLRINSLSTPYGLQDAALIFEMQKSRDSRIDSVFIPKIRSAGELRLYKDLFSSLTIPVKVIPIIETVDAVNEIDDISSLSDAMILGQADLSAEMYSANKSFIAHARAMVCISAARRCIPAIDTNSFELHDMEQFSAECLAAKHEGFIGKAAIHPCQVPIINKTFRVSQEELDHYTLSIEAYNKSAVGFSIVDGKVIAPPFVAKAKKMLDLHATSEFNK